MRQHDQSGGVPPTALALIVCDAVHRDPTTGKESLLGCFDVINAPSFPITHQLMTVYAALTDGRGLMPFTISLVDTDEEREPIRVDGSLEFPNPRGVATLVVPLRKVPIPAPGEYRVQLFVAGQFVTERRLVAKLKPKS